LTPGLHRGRPRAPAMWEEVLDYCIVISCCSVGLVILVALLIVIYDRIDALLRLESTPPRPRVTVLVLGDLGRSPRMQYHALSLASDVNLDCLWTGSTVPKPDDDKGVDVDLIGYAGEPCIRQLRDHPRVTVRTMPAIARPAGVSIPFVVWAPLKVFLQVTVLLWTLLVATPRPDTVLLQTPPAIPTLAVAWLAALVRGSRVVVDWHNFGYTILAMNVGSISHWMVRLAKIYESIFSQAGHGNLCVTHAMRDWLRAHWGVHASVLHDQPPAFFRRTSLEEMHELFVRLGQDPQPGQPDRAGLSEALWSDAPSASSSTPVKALLTARGADGVVRMRPDRPALIVSSTSWTEDEDFRVLLGALAELDARVRSDSRFPRLLCVVTGKGPQRAMYEAKMEKMRLEKVRIKTMWLDAADYPKLLGCCDLGVSLHSSSSGLDLPMKILDMFGAGMPVCALGFECLDELVQDGHNGLVFESSKQLADQLQQLLTGFPDARRLAELRSNVKPGRWSDNWVQHALPVILPDLSPDHVD